MPDRFDLEQQIHQTWRITEDLHDLIEAFDNMSHDERYNYLIGLRAIYETKFEKLWSIFEKLVHTGQLGSNNKTSRTLDEVYDEVDRSTNV